MDILEQQLLLDQSQAKSPGLAAVMGFFFPWLPAFYTGHVVKGILLVFLDLVFMALSFVGIGLLLLLLYGFVGAYQGHKWAKEYNQKKLQQLVDARKASVAA